MKKTDCKKGRVVALNALPTEMAGTVVETFKREAVIELYNGKRMYVTYGHLTNPRVVISIPLEIIIESDGDSWHVSCPELRGFHTCGTTIKESLRNAKYAGQGFLKSTVKHYNEEHDLSQ